MTPKNLIHLRRIIPCMFLDTFKVFTGSVSLDDPVGPGRKGRLVDNTVIQIGRNSLPFTPLFRKDMMDINFFEEITGNIDRFSGYEIKSIFTEKKCCN